MGAKGQLARVRSLFPLCGFRDWTRVIIGLAASSFTHRTVSLTPLQVFVHYYNGFFFSLIKRILYVCLDINPNICFKFVDYLFTLLRLSFEKYVLIALRKLGGGWDLNRDLCACDTLPIFWPGSSYTVYLLNLNHFFFSYLLVYLKVINVILWVIFWKLALHLDLHYQELTFDGRWIYFSHKDIQMTQHYLFKKIFFHCSALSLMKCLRRWKADLDFLLYSSCLAFFHVDLNQVFVLARQTLYWLSYLPAPWIPLFCSFDLFVQMDLFRGSLLYCAALSVPSWCCSTVITSFTKPLDRW